MGDVLTVESKDEGRFSLAAAAGNVRVWEDGSYVRTSLTDLVNPVRYTIAGPYKVVRLEHRGNVCLRP